MCVGFKSQLGALELYSAVREPNGVRLVRERRERLQIPANDFALYGVKRVVRVTVRQRLSVVNRLGLIIRHLMSRMDHCATEPNVDDVEIPIERPNATHREAIASFQQRRQIFAQ